MPSLLYRPVCETSEPDSVEVIKNVECEVGRFKATSIPSRLQSGWYASVEEFPESESVYVDSTETQIIEELKQELDSLHTVNNDLMAQIGSLEKNIRELTAAVVKTEDKTDPVIDNAADLSAVAGNTEAKSDKKKTSAKKA